MGKRTTHVLPHTPTQLHAAGAPPSSPALQVVNGLTTLLNGLSVTGNSVLNADLNVLGGTSLASVSVSGLTDLVQADVDVLSVSGPTSLASVQVAGPTDLVQADIGVLSAGDTTILGKASSVPGGDRHACPASPFIDRQGALFLPFVLLV